MVQDLMANLVCEKLLNNVKASNLNYLLNETPYSAYITIRKRFNKDYQDLINVTLVQDIPENVHDYKKENTFLKSKCKFLETELESSKKQNTEYKDNLAGFEKENIAITQKLFILKGELENCKETSNKEHEQIDTIQRENQSLKDQLTQQIKKLKGVNDSLKDREDIIDMLNLDVENKNSELDALREKMIQHPKEVVQSKTFTCNQCDYTSESEKGIKIHMGRKHEVKCDKCNEKFGGDQKLRTHMCRIHVTNPTYKSIYIKDWYLRSECIRIFCNEEKKQLAILHSKDCEEENPCHESPENFKFEVTVKDKDGMIHLHASPNIDINTVDWGILHMNIFHNTHIW